MASKERPEDGIDFLKTFKDGPPQGLFAESYQAFVANPPEKYTCVGIIDAGSSQAQAELLFLVTLLVELGDRVDPASDFSGTLGFTDVFRCPALGADNFIQVEKASVGLLKDMAALRVRALDRVRHLVKKADSHHATPPH